MGAPAIEVVALDAVRASDILPQIRGVLSVRQQQVLRMVAGPEDRTLILAGPAGDVAAVKEVLPVFDKLRAGERDIVILPLRGADAQASVERALTLARDRLAGRALSSEDQSIEAAFDALQGTVRIEATPIGVDAFRTALDELDQIPLVAPTVRQVVGAVWDCCGSGRRPDGVVAIVVGSQWPTCCGSLGGRGIECVAVDGVPRRGRGGRSLVGSSGSCPKPGPKRCERFRSTV